MSETPYAFPTRTSRDELTEDGYRPTVDQHHGMTLRDYFAAHAILGVMERTGTANPNWLASDCYRIADAMLAEREKGGK